MEFFAKSPGNVLTKDECDDYCNKIEMLMDSLGDQLEVYENNILMNAIINMRGEKESEHVTLNKHLNDIVDCAEKFFEIYGDFFSDNEKKLIILACKLHDIGKANLIFQSLVNPELGKMPEKQIPHGFLSTCILSKNKFLEENPDCDTDDFRILVTAVYYHHTRFDDYETDQIKEYCHKYYENYVREYCQNLSIVLKNNRTRLLFNNSAKGNKNRWLDENVWCKYMLIKGMLNKFDWTVSAGYAESELSPDITDKKLCANIEVIIGNSFRPAQQYMTDKRDNSLVITAPTGSGKTEAALLWLNGEKGFYTLPLKVSSNAIYNRIRNNYGYKDVTLLHSDSINIYLKESMADFEESDGYENYQRSKLFSQPLTVCTVDQLFKFVYKALGTEIFAAALKYSKVIIDEIQSYSPRVVASLIFGLSEIHRMGGKFAIITATFPPVLKYFMDKCGLLEDIDYLYRDFSEDSDLRRHKIEIRHGEFNIEEIVSRSSREKVLVICNTVSNAQRLYEKVSEYTENVNLLHSRFIRSHRDALESKIMKFSGSKDEYGIWITTQIVEASLDIDFDILYTEMCTADSLLQRLGRCNRAGRCIPEEANVFVYVNGSGRGTVYEDKDLYDRSMSVLMEYENRLFSEKDKTEYINEVYSTDKIKGTLYFSKIDKYLKNFKELAPLDYDKSEADKEFRKINSVTVIPDKIYNENQYVIDTIISFLKDSRGEHSVKAVLNSRLASMTLSMSIYGRFPENVDKGTLGNTGIHRTGLKYDFDVDTGRGLGLVLDKMDDELLFL